MKKYFIRLDVQKPTDTDYIQVIKQDTLANTLYITLLNAGELIPMSEFTFVEVVADKPDETQWISSGEVIGDGQVKIDLEYQAIATEGVVDISIKLYTGEVVMTTYPFQLRVIADPNAGTDGSVASSSEYPILTAMADNETGRLSAEAGRVLAEDERVSAETIRLASESDRVADEALRDSAETDRLASESARDTAEGIRDSNETTRLSQESGRVSTESARATAEGLRDTAETTRLSQESARVTAEGLRDTAETARESAEAIRVSQETARETAEGTRVTQEAAREAAETVRGTAYTQAETARDNAYDLAETARDGLYSTAEGGRDTQYGTAEDGRGSQYSTAETARDTLYGQAEDARDSLYATAEANRDALTGDLSGLTTTDKTSLVNAVNELDADKVDKVAGKSLSTEDYTSAEKAKVANIPEDTNAQLADYEQRVGTLEEAVGNLITVDSWQTVQEIVRSGEAEKYFEVGDQLVTTYDGVEYVLDVIGINHDEPADPQYTNSLTLQFHDCIMNCQFDAPEWLFYAEAELVAGTYYFYDSYNSANYEFTTTQSVPLGGSIDVSVWGDSQNPTEVKTYDASGVLLETLPVAVSATGTELTTCNDLRCVRYGSNNYLESNIREFLNSEEDTFQFDKQTVYDRASAGSPYNGAGFLKNLDPELRAVIGPVDKQVIRNTVTDGGGQDLFSDTVFLLSRKEVYGVDEGNVTGEAPYAYYEAMAASPTTGDLDGRIKYLSGSARHWWLRSPNPANSYAPRYVIRTGGISSNYAHSAYGLAPACTIY